MDTDLALDPAVSAGRLTCIYALVDPRTAFPRYVGKSTEPAKRWRQHLAPWNLERRSKKNSWLKSLLTEGLEPELDVLDRVPEEQTNHAEREWISLYREFFGFDLTNGTDGGDGGAITDPDALARIRAAHVGRVHSEEEKRRRSESQKKRFEESAQREKWRQAALRSGNKPPVHRGEANPMTALTDADVLRLREAVAEGWPMRRVAEAFEITTTSVWQLATGQFRVEAGGPIRAKGSRTKLSESDIEQIRCLVREGHSRREVAQAFGVDPSYVTRIVNRNVR
jgi:hypothetical protein